MNKDRRPLLIVLNSALPIENASSDLSNRMRRSEKDILLYIEIFENSNAEKTE